MIQIPDSVFERLFQFFDGYTWHLDDRPLRADNEINPDVLGYIFEKYINQKQMGAYYTKEDITGYICRNTVLPFLLDKLGTLRYDAVHPLPLADVEPYIYPAVKQVGDLPTETEREYAARMKRLAALRALTPHSPLPRPGRGRGDGGEGGLTVNDLITYNLDIEKFVQDFLRSLNDPLTLRAFYFECLTKLTVLDPTVGSGAFLFAAMNILEPLYEICLDKMPQWAGPKYPDFKDELARVAAHPNRRYFIFKNIIVNNLYGVDIMEEATEICKLRLFLKLVAQIDDADHVEPLPDIDFNIRAGNSLVGYASLAEVEQAASRSLFNIALPQKIREADVAIRAFRELQTRLGISARALAQAKADTQAKLEEIEKELNEALKNEYGARSLEKFVGSHQPFHWYVEFNQIMQDGGFDVIVGNPPYVEYGKVRNEYQVRGYKTDVCGNLFAFIMERSCSVIRQSGRFGMIIPMSFVSTERMAEIRDRFSRAMSVLAVSNYSGDAHPSVLFNGVKMRLSIVLSIYEAEQVESRKIFSTNFLRWYPEERFSLFQRLSYREVPERFLLGGLIPKVNTKTDLSILERLFTQSRRLGEFVIPASEHAVYAHRIVAHFVKSFDFVPYFRNDRDGEKKSEDYKVFSFADREQSSLANAILNSSTFYYFYLVYSDAYHCGRELILALPCDLSSMDRPAAKKLRQLNEQLMSDLRVHSVRRKIEYHGTGWIEYDEFYPRLSKSIIDELDRVLARH